MTILDPCLTANLSLENNSVFKEKPEITLTQYVNYEEVKLTWSDSMIKSTAPLDLNCGPLTFKIWDEGNNK